jgi:4-hydroxy-tetrahydrodipicolinate reductase
MTAADAGGSGPEARRLILVGRGRMGRLVERLSPEYGFHVVGVIRRDNSDEAMWPDADVAIDFSVSEAVPANFRRCAERRLCVVIGTTGWQAEEAALREIALRSGIGVVAAANFALGVNLFQALVERAAGLLASRPEFGAWIHELHHSAKRDAPSGTALALQAAMRRSGYSGPIDVASTRAGSIPGTHTVGFDAAAETITLTHTARDRSIFARGALEAARWLDRRSGWYTMRDVLGL